ncbi:MAG: diguanylate cyclase, partial [Eggerthellaceae bacterium]|nr:diguanylate cyclase [Eggerthellaceae bacterium]
GLGPVYRVGGDEFAVCCFELDERAGRRIADDLRAACAAVGVAGRSLSLSVGWAVREAGEDIMQAHRRADERMYEDKARAHRGRRPGEHAGGSGFGEAAGSPEPPPPGGRGA